MKMGIIYCAYNKKNGKRYIGQTFHDLEKRKRVHYSKYSNCIFFHRALMEYKKEDWEWKIIDNGDMPAELNLKEQFWIKFFNTTSSQYGYNIGEGGQGNIGKHSEISRQKTRNSMLRSKKTCYVKQKSQTRGVQCVETHEKFYSIASAVFQKGISRGSIEKSLKNNKAIKNMTWEYLSEEETRRLSPNAFCCIELRKIYANYREARIEDNFHQGNLRNVMETGDPKEIKKYAGYSFYFLNPQFHI